jgi:uncharacterized protein YjiS (DUF1127 family)
MPWFSVPLSTFDKDALGYLAGGLVLCTFWVRSMRLLRCLGIASNVSFISYAMVMWLPPIAILHGLLLPINVFRLIQLERERNAGQSIGAPVPDLRPTRVGALYGRLTDFMRQSRQRAELRQLDHRERQDLGFTRVLDEGAKRFWQQ